MMLRFLSSLLTCAALALPAAPAAAIAVTGSFAGTAHVSPSSFLARALADVGTPVTGTFSLEIPTEAWGDGSGVAPPSARITFDLNGERFSFMAGPEHPDAPGNVSVASDPTQSVSFLTSYQPRFDGAILTFGSRDGLMFNADDFSTLAINSHTVSWMTASFASAKSALVASIDVQSFQFGGVAAPVDEPPVWVLMLAGVAGMAAWRGRRRPAVGHPDAGSLLSAEKAAW